VGKIVPVATVAAHLQDVGVLSHIFNKRASVPAGWPLPVLIFSAADAVEEEIASDANTMSGSCEKDFDFIPESRH